MTTAHDMPSGEFDRGRKLLIIQRLEEVGTYAEGNRLLCILKLPESRQDNVLGIDLLAQAGNDIEPRHSRHLDVHDQHIGMVFPRHEDALHPAGGRTDHLRTKILPRGQLYDALPLQRLIINHKHFNHRAEPPPCTSTSTAPLCPSPPYWRDQSRSPHPRSA